MLSTYSHLGVANDTLGGRIDVELEERRDIAAGCSDIEDRPLVDEEGFTAETEQEGQRVGAELGSSKQAYH